MNTTNKSINIREQTITLFKLRDIARKEGNQKKEKETINEIVTLNMPLVPFFLHSMSHCRDYEDFLQEGYIGLMKAANNYDLSSGSFSNYAKYWIKQRVLRFQYENNLIHVPTNLMQTYQKYDRLLKNGWSIKNATSETNMSYNEYRSLFAAADVNLTRLEAEISSNDGKLTIGDIVPSDEDIETNCVDDFYYTTMMDEICNSGLLTDREIKIFTEFHGINDKKPKRTLDDLGKSYGLTRERIRQINNKACRKVITRLKKKKLLFKDDVCQYEVTYSD